MKSTLGGYETRAPLNRKYQFCSRKSHKLTTILRPQVTPLETLAPALELILSRLYDVPLRVEGSWNDHTASLSY
jgi:hypothetical protein